MTDRIYINKDVIFTEGDLHPNQMIEGVNETELHHKLDNIYMCDTSVPAMMTCIGDINH